MKKRSLAIMVLAGVMMASCACGTTETTTETTTQATTAATTEEKTTTEATTEATTQAKKEEKKEEKKTASESDAKSDDKKEDKADSADNKSTDSENTETTDTAVTTDLADLDLSGNTTASPADVVAFLDGVVADIKNSSWDSLGDKIAYPITIGSTEVASKDEFVSLMEGSTVAQTFLDDVASDSSSNIRSNGQGMGAFYGHIWMMDENYGDDSSEPSLKVKSLNGLIAE